MDNISQILNTFNLVTLEEMDSVKLLNRMDTKFTFRANLLPQILEELKPHYKVLDINGIKMSRYKTLYYDTPDKHLYTQHQNGKLNRYKVRLRRYEDSDLNFFEIKFKTNKKRTIKQRVTRSKFSEIIKGKSERFLIENSPFTAEMLLPSLYIYYLRITLVSNTFTERLTIDLGLTFKDNDNEKSFPKLIIVEVKQDHSANSPAINILRKYKIQNISISKYCLGIISLFNNVKKNNFKVKLQKINKICYEGN